MAILTALEDLMRLLLYLFLRADIEKRDLEITERFKIGLEGLS